MEIRIRQRKECNKKKSASNKITYSIQARAVTRYGAPRFASLTGEDFALAEKYAVVRDREASHWTMEKYVTSEREINLLGSGLNDIILEFLMIMYLTYKVYDYDLIPTFSNVMKLYPLSTPSAEFMSKISCIPPELKSIVNSALSDLIPKKSKRQYEKCYSEFKDWCDKQNVKTMSENILLAYLMQQSKFCLLNIQEGIDVRKFLKLVPFLERKAVGYQAKKSKVFTREQIDSFLKEANDNKYLMLK
ncbi:hypothetical protein NQ317_005419, partial [Molorchus minor]